jgi:hypothetical protein
LIACTRMIAEMASTSTAMYYYSMHRRSEHPLRHPPGCAAIALPRGPARARLHLREHGRAATRSAAVDPPPAQGTIAGVADAVKVHRTAVAPEPGETMAETPTQAGGALQRAATSGAPACVGYFASTQNSPGRARCGAASRLLVRPPTPSDGTNGGSPAPPQGQLMTARRCRRRHDAGNICRHANPGFIQSRASPPAAVLRDRLR